MACDGIVQVEQTLLGEDHDRQGGPKHLGQGRHVIERERSDGRARRLPVQSPVATKPNQTPTSDDGQGRARRHRVGDGGPDVSVEGRQGLGPHSDGARIRLQWGHDEPSPASRGGGTLRHWRGLEPEGPRSRRRGRIVRRGSRLIGAGRRRLRPCAVPGIPHEARLVELISSSIAERCDRRDRLAVEPRAPRVQSW